MLFDVSVLKEKKKKQHRYNKHLLLFRLIIYSYLSSYILHIYLVYFQNISYLVVVYKSEKLEDAKEVVKKTDRQYNGQKKQDKTMIYKTLQRKQKTEQHGLY